MSEIDLMVKRAFEEMESHKKDIILPKGMYLLLHGCPIQLKDRTIVRADPSDILFALNKIEENNLLNRVKVDITGLLDSIRELNPEINFQ